MVPELIKMFQCVAVGADEHLFRPEMVNMNGVRYGYLVHPEACTKDVLKFFELEKANYNSTFYKSWHDVENLSEAEMKVLQLLHYLSTYGTNYEGKTFTMNDFPEDMRFAELKILMPCTEQSLFDRINAMLQSGMPIKAETLNLLFKQLHEFYKKHGWKIDITTIKNQEAKAKYYIDEKLLPYDASMLMRIIMYVCRDDTMIINDLRTRKGIEERIKELIELFSVFDAEHLKLLSSVFYRFKTLFLLMRKSARLLTDESARRFVTQINKIRKMAVKNHRPFHPGILQTIASIPHTDREISEAINKETSVFTLIKINNYLKSLNRKQEVNVYLIRNGKVYVKVNTAKRDYGINNDFYRDCIKDRIHELLKHKAVNPSGVKRRVKLPENLSLAAPSSEKMFLGAIPYGSFFEFDKADTFIGIYWRNEWGTRDFDLWVIGEDGQRLGWADKHKDDNILFSGDMTNADPEATEIMYCRNTWPDATIRVYRYNGTRDSKFRIFFGAEYLKELPRNYMVNPSSILFHEDLISNSKEKIIGVIFNNRLCFGSLDLGNLSMPLVGENMPLSYEKAFIEHFSSYSTLKEILEWAGYEISDERDDTKIDVDLSKDLSKDSIMALLTP